MDNKTPQAATAPETPKTSLGELLFEIFCASIFLGMIGLVFYNAILRYVFRSSFPPSEEWARFLFTYITFFGGIEAFYRKKHIAVDLVVGFLHGSCRKIVDILALLFSLAAMAILLVGSYDCVLQNMDTYAVATGINMGIVSGALLIMAIAALVLMARDLFLTIRKPSSEFKKPEQDA